MDQKICIAVVGCGRIATNGHFPAFRALSDMVRVKYACDLIESKAALKQKEYPELVENVIADYKIALADPEVEAVYVLTPNYAHYVRHDGLVAGGQTRVLRKTHHRQLQTVGGDGRGGEKTG